MDLGLIFAYVRAVVTELWLRKLQVIFVGSVVALVILFAGTKHQVKFETSMLILADNQSILKPLLERQAAVTRIQDHLRVVRDLMLSPRLLRLSVAELYPDVKDELAIEQKIKSLRQSLNISGVGQGTIRISVVNHSPSMAFDSLNVVTDLFIKDSSESQKSESREAFKFIDNQVLQYKNQLVDAEERVKAFKASNIEGSIAGVSARITELKNQIEEMNLDIEDAQTRVAAIQKQLDQEQRLTSKTYEADVYRQRLAKLQAQKDQLLLRYQESYPDVVNITLQIEDMKAAILESERTDVAAQGDADASFNPLYAELRSKLSEAEVELKAKKRRLASTEKLLEAEYERRAAIAEGEAELAELQRDYDVTRDIYEDMLARKEKARLSMTLTAEGQGVSYKVQEPPVYPTSPTGMRFLHFAVLGILFGVAVPVGLVTVYILLDPRIRFLSQLETATKVPVLAVVPHTMTPISRRIMRFDAILACVWIAVFCAVYLSVILAYKADWLA